MVSIYLALRHNCNNCILTRSCCYKLRAILVRVHWSRRLWPRMPITFRILRQIRETLDKLLIFSKESAVVAQKLKKISAFRQWVRSLSYWYFPGLLNSFRMNMHLHSFPWVPLCENITKIPYSKWIFVIFEGIICMAHEYSYCTSEGSTSIWFGVIPRAKIKVGLYWLNMGRRLVPK